MAEGNGTGTSPAASVALSPIEEIRRRKGTMNPPAGERGQIKAAWYAFWRHLIGTPNPAKLKAADFDKMELDEQVQAGILIREYAMLGKPPAFNYAPRDPNDPAEAELGKRMVAFLTKVWRELDPSPNEVLRNILSAHRYGFSVNEIVWASTTGPDGEPVLRTMDDPDFPDFVYIERIKLLPAETIENNGFLIDPFGNLRGVVQYLPPVPRNLVPERAVADPQGRWRIVFDADDLKRLIVYSPRKGAGNWYGRSDHTSAYNRWFSKQFALTARNVLLERLSGVVLGKYSNPSEQDVLDDALDNIGPGSVLTIPIGSEVEILKGWEGAVKGFEDAIRQDDVAILRAYLVPQESVGGNDTTNTGSFARANVHFEAFLVGARLIQQQLEDVVNRSFVKPLIDANFGPVPAYPTFNFPEMREKDRAQLAQIYRTAVETGYVDPRIDADWMRQEMGVPEDAPPDFVFERPTPGGASPSPTTEPAVLPRVHAQRAAPRDDSAPTLMEQREPRALSRVTVDHLESLARSRLADAILALQTRILENVPQSDAPEELARISIPPTWLRAVLDDLAAEVLKRVRADLAQRFRDIGKDDIAQRVVPTESAPIRARRPKQRRTRLQAQDEAPEDVLRSYSQWAASMNELASEQAAAELQSRLRRRVLQAYARGLLPDEIALGLREEFATYTEAQLETVSRTTVMDYYNSARNAAFDAAGSYILGVKFVPLLDSATTPFCRALVGRSIARTDPLYEKLRNPPFFHNCRTTVSPILADEREHAFNTDWADWLTAHRNDPGGGFVTGAAA